MIQAILTAYVIVKWIGAWSLFEGIAAVCLYSGLCIFALLFYIGSLLSRSTLGAVGALVNDGGLGIFIAPALWILFFTLYPLGLVDWLVALHILKNNQGYFFSHATPSTFDMIALALTIIIFAAPFFKVWKASKDS